MSKRKPARSSPDGFSIALPDGSVLGPIGRAEDQGEDVPVDLTEEIAARVFDRCPICGDPATTGEHVPPEVLGGRVMTRTCGPCNHGFSSLETVLGDWLDDAIRGPQFQSAGTPGARRCGLIQVRRTAAGEPLLILDGACDPALDDILQRGAAGLLFARPDRRLYSLALLKHAYLAACMKFGVPEGKAADQVRRDLIAARNASGLQNVPASKLALGLTILRQGKPAPIPPVVYAIAHLPDGPRPGVILAGRVFVSWSSDLPPDDDGRSQPTSVRLTIGTKLHGSVTR